jgi:hypothetical protein
VLDIHIGRNTALLLRLRDNLQGDRRLARRFRAVDLGDTPLGNAADTKRDVKRERPVGIASTALFFDDSPSRMTEPLPNCFSICDSASSKARSFSTFIMLLVLILCVC